jgi:hypothetical protein
MGDESLWLKDELLVLLLCDLSAYENERTLQGQARRTLRIITMILIIRAKISKPFVISLYYVYPESRSLRF